MTQHNATEFSDTIEIEPSKSLFLTPHSRLWAKNLNFKVSFLSALLLLAAFILSFFPLLTSISHLLLLFVFFLVGTPALIAAIEDLLDWEINIDILMTLGAFLSLWIDDGIEGGLLLVLFAISGAIEHSVLSKAKGALTHLNKLSPKKAHVILEKGKLLERSIHDITIGTSILVKAGEVVPLDGEIVTGSSSLELGHLTGEYLPIRKTVGNSIPAGAYNLEGSLTVKVTKTSCNSTLSRIISLITEAQENKPKLQRWIDKVSTYYASTIILASLSFALIIPFITSLTYLGNNGSIERALSFLIAASPCALIIAIPIAYLSAMSACAKNGILIKGSIVLDALDQCEYVAFDKTGTLTEGTLKCIAIESPSLSKETILSYLYSLERNVSHPMAHAIVLKAEEEHSPLQKITDFKSTPGEGIEATIQGKSIKAGRPEFIIPDLKNPESLKKTCSETKKKGTPFSVVLIDDEWGIIHFSDTIRKEMKTMLSTLTKQKKHPLMLTGDHEKSAKQIANIIGLKEYYSDLSPEEKLSHVTRLSKEKGLTMIGDGVNDAPALARATVGISMGKMGSSTTIEVSDVVFLHDNLDQLPWLFSKAKQTKKILIENLYFAGGVISIVSTLALFGIVPLWLAVILHEGGTIIVGLNGLRLLKKKNPL